MKVENCTLLKALNCNVDETIVNVAKTLKENKQRRIIIIDEKKSPVGIISTTDINNK
ncbi:CBS domain-containing protein, partial [archaeon]|nr:CBS domain-containing protein [archaeon]MBT4272360.1 CBS domain-containing protein [archaeon]MBT6772573.1 CBS domain-containing protein [archaeon]